MKKSDIIYSIHKGNCGLCDDGKFYNKYLSK